MTIIDEFLEQYQNPFGSPEIVRLMIPMDRNLVTYGDVRERLYANVIGHIPTIDAEFLDDLLMVLADNMTVGEAKRILMTVREHRPDLFTQYRDTILDNAPSDRFIEAITSLEI